jgi:acyl-CoA reductase-like NAD-dependent aldehyde dehydrogenase
MSSTKRNFIGGEWIEPADAAPSINPSDVSDIVGEFTRGSEKDVDLAVDCARAAFPAWAHAVPYSRQGILQKIANELMARREELGHLLSREQGKILSEGIAEVTRSAQIFEFFAGECVRQVGDTVASPRPGVGVEVTREPLGIVGMICPWNFPLAIPAWKIAPALAYGNCVVFKPADLTPGIAHALTDIISRSGLPAGVFNLVMGRGSSVGQRIIDHPDIAGITFTGSVNVGRRVAASAVSATRMKKLQMEMGGKNPQVILDDAELEQAVELTLNSAYFSAGQRCTASERLIVTEGIHDRFVARLTERLEAMVVDHALKPHSHMGPVIDAKQLEQNLEYVDIARKEGATVHFGGMRLQRETEGFYMAPALFTQVTNDMRIAREEVFGPVAAVIRVKDYDEALAVANDTPFGLSSGICTTSLKHAAHFKRHSDAGMVMVNLPTAGVDFHVPFGGRKASSYGPREQGSYAREFFTQVKTSYILP